MTFYHYRLFVKHKCFMGKFSFIILFIFDIKLVVFSSLSPCIPCGGETWGMKSNVYSVWVQKFLLLDYDWLKKATIDWRESRWKVRTKVIFGVVKNLLALTVFEENGMKSTRNTFIFKLFHFHQRFRILVNCTYMKLFWFLNVPYSRNFQFSSIIKLSPKYSIFTSNSLSIMFHIVFVTLKAYKTNFKSLKCPGPSILVRL